jgi:hypothetical protein
MRAKGSVDVSSATKDVRVKAERNLHMLAGNSGTGSLLLESKGQGLSQDFRNKYGEDVVSNGVILKSAGVVAAYGSDIYLRTGIGSGSGDILLDAAKGSRRVQVFSREFHTYTTKAVSFNFGPVNDTSEVKRTYQFGEKSAVMDVQLLLGGRLLGYNGGGGAAGVVVDGGIYCTKSIATAGVMADSRGSLLGKVPEGFENSITSTCNIAASAVPEFRKESEERHQLTVVDKFYRDGQLGNDESLKDIAFSFRDPLDSTSQYGTEGFLLPESRWQQAARLGLGSGGTSWTEKPVRYQGRDTYPWPGKKKWVDTNAFVRFRNFTFIDATTGSDASNLDVYKAQRIAEAESVAADTNFTVTGV